MPRQALDANQPRHVAADPSLSARTVKKATAPAMQAGARCKLFRSGGGRKMRFSKAGVGILVLGALALVSGPVRAQHEGRGHEEVHVERFHGDIGRFHEHDWAVWHSGRWFHGDHGGRLGWWWVAGGVWFFYPYPIYPYPDPYLPPDLPVPAEPLPPTPTNWYYCQSAQNYYPYVTACPEGWRAVPAKPAMPTAPR